MIFILSTIIFIISLILLVTLCVIDLRERLLPDIYVLPFGLLGLLFHAINEFFYTAPADLVLGATLSALMLYALRYIANRIYQQDTLGLGDVKLIAAAGLWLGVSHIFPALGLGAFCGILHGLGLAVYIKHKIGILPSLRTLSLPAGPGFIVGIIITFLIKILWT